MILNDKGLIRKIAIDIIVKLCGWPRRGYNNISDCGLVLGSKFFFKNYRISINKKKQLSSAFCNNYTRKVDALIFRFTFNHSY